MKPVLFLFFLTYKTSAQWKHNSSKEKEEVDPNICLTFPVWQRFTFCSAGLWLQHLQGRAPGCRLLPERSHVLQNAKARRDKSPRKRRKDPSRLSMLKRNRAHLASFVTSDSGLLIFFFFLKVRGEFSGFPASLQDTARQPADRLQSPRSPIQIVCVWGKRCYLKINK